MQKKQQKLASIVFVITGLFAWDAWAGYPALYNPTVPTKINIDFDNPEAYRREINEIVNSEILNISQEEKKSYKVKVSFSEENQNKECKGNANINGDWKDHVDAKNTISSLNIKLNDNCSIGGIKKFKLFLENTRGGVNEVFWTMLLEDFGFPTYYTKIIDASINGFQVKAVFQEKSSNFFLERHGIKASPIVKADERQTWNVRSEWFRKAFVEKSPRIESPTSPFGFWLESEVINYDGESKGFGLIDNSEYLKSDSDMLIAIKAVGEFKNPNKRVVNERLFNDLNKMYAPHALADVNKRNIYIPMINSFIPLYYDGNVDFNGKDCKIDELKMPTQHFENEYKNRTGVDLSDEMKCAYQNSHALKTESNWNEESYFSDGLKFNYYHASSDDHKSGFSGMALDSLIYRNNDYYLCSNDRPKRCTKIRANTAKNVLTGKIIKYKSGFPTSVVIDGYVGNKPLTRFKDIVRGGKYTINVNKDEKYFLTLGDGSGRDINVTLEDKSSRLIVSGVYSANDKITVRSNHKSAYDVSPHEADELSLTGCLTFYKTKFDGGFIRSEALGCEDGVNVVSSTGFVNQFVSHAASQDSLDVDFSNLEINSILVEKAGNDCVDLSAGSYSINSAILKSCTDKGISIGERSHVKINDLFVESSDIGIANKDSSELYVKSYISNNNKSCSQSYIKKNTFSNPLESFDSKICK